MSTTEPLHLTKTQIFYCKTALTQIAQIYEKEGQPQHAQGCRLLATRIETHQSDRRDRTLEEAAVWQQRFAQCGHDQEKMLVVAREWFYELLSTAVDPVKTFLDAFMPLLHIGRQQTALEILVVLDQKLADFAAKEFEADQALDEIITYLRSGQADLRAGRQMWADDPDLPRLVQRSQKLPTPDA